VSEETVYKIWSIDSISLGVRTKSSLWRMLRILHMRQENESAKLPRSPRSAKLTNPPEPHCWGKLFPPDPRNEPQSVFDGSITVRFEVLRGKFLKIIWSNGEIHLHLIWRRRETSFRQPSPRNRRIEDSLRSAKLTHSPDPWNQRHTLFV
jgi:hypothetical protein